jgi:predicted ATP-dependent serine protease
MVRNYRNQNNFGGRNMQGQRQNSYQRNYNNQGGNVMRNQNNTYNQNQTYQRNYNNYQQNQQVNYQQRNSNYRQNQSYYQQGQSLAQIQEAQIDILQGTIFDIFSGIEQAFIGIKGEAGAGKTQTTMRLVADLSRIEPVLLVLTEQNPQRWKALFRKYIDNNLANPQNVRVIYTSNLTEQFIDQVLTQAPERIIVIDSISGAVQEQNARRIARKLRNLSEFRGKFLIGVFQVRNTGNIAGGEGVEHMIERSFTIHSFILKPQHVWYRRKLETFGYEIGDEVKLIREEFNKIRGIQNRNIVVLDIRPDNPILELRELRYNQEEHRQMIEQENQENNSEQEQSEQE